MESQFCITDFQVSYANQPLVRVVGSANHGVCYFSCAFSPKMVSIKILVHTA